MPEPAPSRPLPADLAALACGLASVAWLVPALWPDAGLPAWPGASLGVAALALAGRPGRPRLRAAGAFAGIVGAALGFSQLAVLWGAARLWP